MATPTTLPATFTSGAILTAAQQNDLRGAFRILQVVNTIKTTVFNATTATFVDVTGLTASITPTFNTSKILVMTTVQGVGGDTSGSGDTGYRIVRGSTEIAVNTDSVNQRFTGQLSRRNTGSTAASVFSACNFLDSPATTSSTTYTVQVRNNAAGIIYINRDQDNTGSVSTITLFEVSA